MATVEYGVEGLFGRKTMDIALALVAVSAIALLVSHSQGAAQVITATGSTFANLLRVVTLQPTRS